MAGISSATLTANALATAPVNEGNSIADTSAIVATWIDAGYDPDYLTTSAATKSLMLDYWQNDAYLLLNNNIGHINTAASHGSPAYGVYAYNNNQITSTEINDLDPYQGLASSYIFMNGCNSYQNPLRSAFKVNNINMYIGGVTLLPLYDSEDTAADFWDFFLIQGLEPADALSNAVALHGTGGMYGILMP
ncbi:hypothetical protein [Methanoregula sp. PtaU1.Bin006]|nr:hypothetical protein [Methanoregula sp. PtaU1.Bin006]